MAEDLVTLGFAFSAGNADTEINKLISALNTLDEKSQGAQKSLAKLFGGSFVAKIDLARKSLGKFNAGLVQTADFARKTVSAIKPLPTQIAKITAEKLKPIPPEVLKSMAEYSRLVNEAAEAVAKLNVNAKNVKPGPVVQLNNAMRQTGRHAEDLGESISQMFRTGTLAAYFKQATDMAVKFGTELAYINSLTLEFDTEKIRTGLLNLSSTYGSATKNAEALYYAYSSGVRGSEADLVDFTRQMAGLSTLIRADVVQTMDAATSAMNAYNLSARDAAQLTDLFYGIVKQGKARGSELASGLGQVISTARTAGLSLDEMGASIASLTKVMKTRNAITYFNNMLSKMIKPTKETRLAAEKLGIELGLDALRAKGFAGVMQEIHDKTRGSQQAILSLFPDLRGQRAALQLLNAGWEDYQNQLQFFANKSGIADEAMKELANDAYFQLSRVPDTLNKIKIATGDLLVQIFTLGGVLTPLIAKFNDMGEAGQTIAGTLVLVAGGYALVKTSQKLHLLGLVLEAKYNELTGGQRAREVKQRSAVAAATIREAAAKRRAMLVEAKQLRAGAANNAAIAKKIRMQALLKAETARGLALEAAQAEVEMKAALAKGNHVLAQQLELKYKQYSALASAADTKAVAAETEAIKAEARARTLNAQAAALEAKALKASMAGKIRNMASSAVAPMAAGAAAAKAGMAGSGLAAIPGVGALAAIIGALGPLVVKTALLATGLNTALVTTSTGLAVTTVNATALTGALMNTSLSFAHPIASMHALGAAGASCGVGVAATAVSVGALVLASAALGYTIGTLAYNYIPGLQKAANAVGEAIDNFFTGDFDKNEIRSKVNEMVESMMETLRNSLGTTNRVQFGMAGSLEQAISSQVDDAEKLGLLYARQKKAMKGAAEASLQNVRNAEQWLESLKESLRDKMGGDQVKNADSIANLKKQIEAAKKQLDEAKNAYQSANQALIGIISQTGEMMKTFRERARNYRNMRMSFKNDALEAMLKTTESLPDRVALINKRAAEMYRESGGRWKKDRFGKSFFDIPTDSNFDLQESYSRAKAAAELEIRAIQEEIKAKQKLANAERRANENTVQLIRSMDKFKETTVTAVKANSLEAQKLQSRRFETVTKVPLVTTAQTGLGESQQKLDDGYKRLGDLIKSYQEEAAARESEAAAELKKLNAQAIAMVNQIARAFDADKLAIPLKSLEKMVRSIGTVSY